MKQLVLLATALFFIVSCTQQADTVTKELDEVAKQNVELAKKIIQAYENEDIDAIKEFYSPDAVIIGPQHDMADSTFAFLKRYEDWFEGSDSIHFEVRVILPETLEEGDLAGNWVLIWANISWYDIETGKKLKVIWHSPVRIEEGKIVYEVSYWNEWDMFKQLGAELKWPDKE